ncbi:ATP-grasp domain-containing protein [Flavobacterium gawalongense]|uniref:D-alanine--D-alanine ligase n=1 Tax=Flavobacterium gawalongense TaxID=2594432 RepID=A0A553BY89_9FLAO|nr:D-alanine--D-alanine ligase [Flavobacterium gawalongense]TRX01127.1 D-alanine--D-alanine ligase [Flavobacterium gawalongense]TRX05636.1 D-alanine--D-alanine ligase [Flavobacterium gawalongense]TRX13297.1 D-alanine--D-alanine ligase [Flavobacterium gawalongense]TRX15771.1 D-alanine--D-alanine ligase [Flavobacterium gawalongense]TRX31609.1 D-alanine--D-alanine ligase [Flavobacterium gawalongense]
MKLLFHKITHWEYWPFQIVYIPIYFLWAFYSLKAKSIFFFNASNPTIKNGGFMMESKKAIYDLIPQRYYPKTELIIEGTSLEEILKIIEFSGIKYPLIAKPDIGLRGSGVKKIDTVADLKRYAEKANFDYVVQDLIPFENEVGIFYVRYPHEKKGEITGIVSKEFLIISGDGIATIEQLIRKNPRYELQLKVLKQEYGKKLLKVLPKGEKLNLVPYGNHARGAKFIDGSHWITPKLTDTINEMCLQIPGFYFGRLDVMYTTLDELEQGKNFSIVELNGAASEPTHIYDPKHSLLFAWKELARHITYMYEISVVNHKNGSPYLAHKAGMKEYCLHLEQSNKIVNF